MTEHVGYRPRSFVVAVMAVSVLWSVLDALAQTPEIKVASIARDSDWLPAVENRGEGVFLGFDSAAISAWLRLRSWAGLSVSVVVPVQLFASVAVIVAVPVALGVPVMAPVVALSDKPFGSTPEESA